MTKSRKPIESESREIVDALGCMVEDDKFLENLDSSFALWEETGDPSRALDAIASIWAFHGSKSGDLTPDTLCRIPWWAISAIAEAYGKYSLERKQGNKKIRIGQCFGLEGINQAKRSLRERSTLIEHEWQVALITARALVPAKGKLESAVAEVGARHGMGRAQLMKIWGKWGVLARGAISRKK